ncbi:MAG: hypothetical protein Q7S61_05555 [bacterium]|nr:hypothetical protein [bacterium]
MTIKLLNLNILKGEFLPQIIDFVKKEDFDILHFQEVAGGKVAKDGVDCFSVIQKETGMTGFMPKAWHIPDDSSSYFSNATFYKPQFDLQKKETIWLYDAQEIEYPRIPPENTPRNAVSLLLEIEGKKIYFINTHQAWGPTPVDNPLKLKQGNILYEYLKTLEHPFILSGDFNVSPTSQVIRQIDTLGINLTTQHHLTNTLNPRLHKAQVLFPKGLAVDFVFASRSLKVNNFKLIDNIDLSDHFGLSLEITI